MEDISVAWTIVELRPSGNGVLQTDLERLKLLLERYVSFYGSLEDQRGFPEGFERFLCTRRNTD